MKARLLVWYFLMLFGAVKAQQTLQMDTGAIRQRSFNNSAIASFKKQQAFQYNKLKEPAISLWDNFWSWFWFKIGQLLNTKQGKTTAWTLLVIFVVAMVALFVFKFTGMNKNGLFGRKSGKGLQYTTGSDDINSIAFDEAIAAAEASGKYRLSVRLLYLQVLKSMSDQGHINWQLNKTNTDYIREVSSSQWVTAFKELTNDFEYTWYGETLIDKETYEVLQQKFQSFNSWLQ
ncbi:MAG: DUF4129 domain-containing protein [Chitinophagaceae bacterium]|nr:DUF4129 domain-containing protein [Chitinophagaceae bacterium]